MRINFVAVSLIISVNTLAAADNVSVIGDRATDVSADAWKDIANFPANTSTSKFTGLNISKAYPSSEQDGWQLTINVKDDKNAARNSATSGCKAYSTTPGCLRNLDEKSAKALSLSSRNASSMFGKISTFFHRVDGDASAFGTAAGLPMLVVTVFGPSAESGMAATPEVACVQPNAKEKTSGASHITSIST
ncbi:hypothetical protein VFPPC_05462 [Pochonia chlamydosporia 170]|uniref:Uncharacterized protein n=1 Tax=Pochonia chlamydosporia 170 TaxID=1380566 RepID=A0A179FFW3_METCM|nr:hypothetical protein VFPPC_05462 [Pochonia chlamydosporia 170]OAQ64131.1 hypothetical protein VFPPC_05462 [Pochonia chlamydosporia 170]